MRIHLGLPNQEERRRILEFLLKNETLDEDVNISTLAKLTPQYSGSDLKGLCVYATTECVAGQSTDTAERTLKREHFKIAMRSLNSSIVDFEGTRKRKRGPGDE